MNFFFFFFAGTRVRRRKLGQGHFQCPICATTRPYERCRAADYVHLFWVPVFRLRDLGEVVVCEGCGRTFADTDLASSDRRAPATWVCPSCGNVNPREAGKCLRCANRGGR